MSVQFFYEECRKAMEAEATRLGQQAIDMRASVGLPSDQYAMVQCQTLATAYGLTQAARIMASVYKRLMEPEKKQDEATNSQKQQQRPIYG